VLITNFQDADIPNVDGTSVSASHAGGRLESSGQNVGTNLEVRLRRTTRAQRTWRNISTTARHWVRHGTGGISTSRSKAGVKNEWAVPARSPYSDELLVHNDHGDHWSWEPKHDMPLRHFIDLLNQAAAHFRKLK